MNEIEIIPMKDGRIYFWEGPGIYIAKDTRTQARKWFKLPEGKKLKQYVTKNAILIKPVSDIEIAFELSEICY